MHTQFEEVAPYVSGKRGREVFLNGDPEHGVWTAGQVIGLIHDIPSCADLISRIEREALETVNKAKSLYVEELPESDMEGKPIQDSSANPKYLQAAFTTVTQCLFYQTSFGKVYAY